MSEYNIKTVGDFLQVPPDRRKDCLAEFADWIELAETMTTFSGVCGVTSVPVQFDWIDDGERNRTVIIEPSVGEAGEKP